MSTQNRLIVNERDPGAETSSLAGSGEAGGTAANHSHIRVSVLMVIATSWLSPVIDLT
jgi:hypothetical protein